MEMLDDAQLDRAAGPLVTQTAWTDALHGWPGLRAPDLAELARRTATSGLTAR